MVIFFFTHYAQKNLEKLTPQLQDRITKKLRALKSHPNIFDVLRPLEGFESASHRLRIGDYRVILQISQQTKDEIQFIVVSIGKREDIY